MTKRQIDYASVVLSLDPEREERNQVRLSLKWDYSQVSPLHRAQVESAAVEIAVSGRQMTASVMGIGDALIRVKGLLAHGQFEEWCRVEFGMSERTAQNMMNVARTFAGKSAKISLLSDSTLYLLAAPSTPAPVREQVIEQAESTGRAPSVAEVRKAIQTHKPPKIRQQAQAAKPAAKSESEGEGETQPDEKLLVDWTDEDWAAYGKQDAAEPITDPVKEIVVNAAKVVAVRDIELMAPAENDDRYSRLRRWWVRLMSLQNDLLDWGNLTGRHVATGECERGLRKMLEITERELAILRGEVVEESEGWG